MTGEARVSEMTAAVRREDAKSVWVTGTAGALVIAIAIVMMVLSAPSGPGAQPAYPAQVIVSAVQAPR